MAFNSTTVGEFMTTGSNTNGGFFDSASGGADYSQQAAAQLSLSDIVADGSTTITSVTGGWTALMVGNYIYLDNITTWRRIVTYTDTNTIVLESTVTTGSGITGNVGGALALPTDAIFELATAGVKYWLKAGTYTLTETIASSKNGDNTRPIVCQGYNSVRGDNPENDDRPLIVCGAYYFSPVNNKGFVAHLRGTGTAQYVFYQFQDGIYYNVKAENTSVSADQYGMYGQNYTRFINCEGISTNGRAMYVTLSGLIYNCYGHDSKYGFYAGSSYNYILKSTFAGCTTSGIYQNGDSITVKGNTLYNNAKGFSANGNADKGIFEYNIFDSNTIGLNGNGSAYLPAYIDNNIYNNNGDDIIHWNKGPNASSTDPGLANPGAGDFTPDSTTERTIVVDTVSTVINVGSVQTERGAGGGTPTSWGGIT